jgi:glycosyltransferase involved in cell wall biosynthesis
MLTCLYDTTPYVVTFHSGGHSSSLRNRLRGWQWKVQGPLLRRAGKLISVSEFEASYFEKVLNLPNGSCPVVANGVEGDADVSHEVPQVIPGLIVSPGRLERYKGHHRVIEALSIVRNSVQDARLLILGSGSYEGELRAVIQREGLDECVEIRSIPAIARSQMRHTLGSANVVVILSDYESQGIAAGEALLAGRPLIVTASSALKELSDQGLAVGLPRDASPELLARQIIEVMQRVHVPATPPLPSWDVCAEALLGIYDRVLTQRRS